MAPEAVRTTRPTNGTDMRINARQMPPDGQAARSNSSKQSKRWRFLLAATLTASVTSDPSTASAHSPHDVVHEIVYRSDYESSGVVFALIRGRIMRSSNRGVSWSEVVNGVGGEADQVRAVALSPANAEVGYATTVSGQVVRTADGGDTWLPTARPDERARQLVVSPRSADVVLAKGPRSVLIRTVDGGRFWEHQSLPEGGLADLAFMADGRRLVGVTSQGSVLASTNDGGDWARVGTVRTGGDPVVVDAIDAADGTTFVFVGASEGELLRSGDDGATFELVGSGLPKDAVQSIASEMTTGGSQTLWATMSDSGPFRSFDMGETWTAVGAGTTTDKQAAVRREPHWNVIAPAPDRSGLVLLGGFDGLFEIGGSERSTWRPVETLDEYISGLAVSPNFADDGVAIVMSYIRGAFRSDDGGNSWTTANRGLLNFDNTSAPFPVWRLHNVHFSPDFERDDTVFSATWNDMLRSTDGGHSWQHIELPPSPDDRKVRQFVIAPSPTFGSDSTIYVGSRQGVLYRSTSSGDKGTWREVATLPEMVRSIAISPDITNDRTMLLGTSNRLYRSNDAGSTWSEQILQSDGADELTAKIGVQVVMSTNFAVDGTALAARGAALWITRDHGATWSRAEDLPDDATAFVEAVAISPDFAADGLILVSIRGTGLWRSHDRGLTFEATGRGLTTANLLIADYANPTSSALQFSPGYAEDRTIFAYAQQALIRSSDAGETWDRLTLPPGESVLAEMLESRSGTGRAEIAIVAVGLLALCGAVAIMVAKRRLQTKPVNTRESGASTK